MFDILMYLFESYFNAGSYPDPDKLSIKLSAAGFEEDDISRALDWLSGLEQLNQEDYPESINQSGIRSYADLELKCISTEGLQFIAFWEHNKMITPVEREMIIDRAVAFGRDALPLERVKLIALMVLWNQHEEIDPLLVEDLLTPANSAQIH
jgi:Smg protein